MCLSVFQTHEVVITITCINNIEYLLEFMDYVNFHP
jgi:hypothetical protein